MGISLHLVIAQIERHHIGRTFLVEMEPIQIGNVSVVNDGHADSRFQGLVSAKRRFDRLPQTGFALRCVPAYAGDGYVVRGIIFHVSVECRM